MRFSLIVIAVCAVLSAGCEIPLAGFTCFVTGDRQASMATSGVTEIRVIARAGSLEIAGHPNLGEVRASGTACANSQAHLDDVQLLTRRDGDIVVVETVTEQGSAGSQSRGTGRIAPRGGGRQRVDRGL